jgi:hypothetical protein
LDELAAEVERIVAADSRGDLITTGQWSAGQILQHNSLLIQFSLDGFPFGVSWPTQLLCRLLKAISWKWLVRQAFRRGRQMPSPALRPDDQISVPRGAAILLEQLGRIRRGEQMTQSSPFEGKLTHDQWIESTCSMPNYT